MNIGALRASLGVDNSPLRAGLKQAGTHFKAFEMETKGRINRMRGMFFSLQGALAFTGMSLGVMALARSFIQAASTSEQYQVRLRALLQSTTEGNRLFKEMTGYAERTPFELEEIMGAATALSGVMGGGVDEITKWMPLIGDLAAVSGLGIGLTTQQIIRMYSAGAASADLFRERGILAMLGFQAGVSVSAEETRKRIMESWVKADSQFRGATDELAKTWKGVMSMLSDKWFKFRNLVMDAGLFKFFKSLAKTVDDFFGGMEKSGKMQAWAENISEGIINLAERAAMHVATFYDVVSPLARKLFLVLKDAWDFFKELPPWVQEIGILAAFMGGKKGALLLVSVAAAAEGYIKSFKSLMQLYDEEIAKKQEHVDWTKAAVDALNKWNSMSREERDILAERYDVARQAEEATREASKATDEAGKAVKRFGEESFKAVPFVQELFGTVRAGMEGMSVEDAMKEANRIERQLAQLGMPFEAPWEKVPRGFPFAFPFLEEEKAAISETDKEMRKLVKSTEEWYTFIFEGARGVKDMHEITADAEEAAEKAAEYTHEKMLEELAGPMQIGPAIWELGPLPEEWKKALMMEPITFYFPKDAEADFLAVTDRAREAAEEQHGYLVDVTELYRSLAPEVDEYQKKIQQISLLLSHAFITQEQAIRLAQEALRGYIDSMESAAPPVYKLGEDTRALLESIRDETRQWGQEFEDIIIQMTKTGEWSFRQMASSIIADIQRILIHTYITEKLFGTKGIVTSWLTGLIAAPAGGPGGLGSGVELGGGKIGSVFTMQHGGSLLPGQMALVGEAGPELFLPRVPGQIIPNDRIASGGVTYQQTVNVSPGVAEAVRAEIHKLRPKLMQDAVQAMAMAKRRGMVV